MLHYRPLMCLCRSKPLLLLRLLLLRMLHQACRLLLMLEWLLLCQACRLLLLKLLLLRLCKTSRLLSLCWQH